MVKNTSDFLDELRQNETPEGDEERRERLRTWFLKSLMQRPCTEREARARLETKCTGCNKRNNRDNDGENETANADDAAFMATLMQQAKAYGLIDDAAYAVLFVAGHESWGNNRIAFELRQRGIAKKYIDRALASVETRETETETARARSLVESWLASGIELRKIEARLQRRGFSSRSIRAACHGEDDISW